MVRVKTVLTISILALFSFVGRAEQPEGDILHDTSGDTLCTLIGIPGLPECSSGPGIEGGGATAATDCKKMCPFPCTYELRSILYNGYCYAPIESCTAPSSCTCNGKGVLPALYLNIKHTVNQ
jgi:hypothetical protein